MRSPGPLRNLARARQTDGRVNTSVGPDLYPLGGGPDPEVAPLRHNQTEVCGEHVRSRAY